MRTVWLLGVLLWASTGLSAASDFGGGAPEQRYFTVDVSLVPGTGQAEGYVRNLADFTAIRVQLDVEMLDAGGATLARRIVYVNGDVPARSRAFVRVPVPSGTASVRATVLRFEWVPRGGGA